MPINVESIGLEGSWIIKTLWEDARIGEDDYKLLCSGSKEIFAYGRVLYHDLVNNAYEIGFCWLVPRPELLLDIATVNLREVGTNAVLRDFSRGPKSHNYTKETGRKSN